MNNLKSSHCILLLLSLFLFITSCSAETQIVETQVTETQVLATRIPKPEVNYGIINNEKDFSGKCVLNIRLPNRIYRNELTQIAEYVYENDGKGCTPLFIFYFLPDIEPEIHSAWAWSHFNPQLELTIVGLDLDTEATLTSITPIVEGILIGNWIDSYAGSRLIVISKLDDSYQMTSISRDGSQYTKPLEVEVVNGEERLYQEPRSAAGDYLVIKENGNLVFFDDQGFIQELLPK